MDGTPMLTVILHAKRPDFETTDPEELREATLRADGDALLLMEMVDAYLNDNHHYQGPDDDETKFYVNHHLQEIRRECMEVRSLTPVTLIKIRTGQSLDYTRQVAAKFEELSSSVYCFAELACPELLPQLEQAL
jgi:hypothetical protein